MSTTAMVPVTISREALAFIDRLGQREELEAMIDRARHMVPGLRSIEVVLDAATEEMPAGVVLWTHRDDIGLGNDPTHRNWIDWMAATFPPDVCQSFTLQQFPACGFRPENTLVLISHFANSLRTMLSRIPYLTAWANGVTRHGTCFR